MLARKTLFVQGIYYVATGVWSLVGIRSFQKVTGPKSDVWLVKTVGALVSAVGATLILSSFRKKPPLEARFLSTSSALALASVESVYAVKGRISPVYLLDAAVELFLISRNDKPKGIKNGH